MMIRVVSFAAVASLVASGRKSEGYQALDRLAHMMGDQTGDRMERRRLDGSTPIVALQWNPHWECFSARANRATCAAPAMQAANNMLSDNGVDFASFIELEDYGYQPPAPYKLLGGKVCGKGYSDWAAVLYDSSKWEPVGGASQGCFPTGSPTDARAYIVQRFSNRVGGAVSEVTVAAAHFPHGGSAASYIGNLIRSMGGDGKFIFMADTNSTTSNASLFSQMGVHGGPQVAAEPFHSCCANDGYSYTFDRVLSNLDGHGPVTTKPLGSEPPSWAQATSHHGSEFHLPIMLKFEVY